MALDIIGAQGDDDPAYFADISSVSWSIQTGSSSSSFESNDFDVVDDSNYDSRVDTSSDDDEPVRIGVVKKKKANIKRRLFTC